MEPLSVDPLTATQGKIFTHMGESGHGKSPSEREGVKTTETIRPNEKPWTNYLKPYQKRFLEGMQENRRSKVEEFFDELYGDGKKPRTFVHEIWAIASLGQNGKPYEEYSERDITEWKVSYRSRDPKKRTVRDLHAGAKQFLSWVFLKEKKEVPDYIKNIKVSRIEASVSAEDILPRKDMRKLLHAASSENPRDPALMHCHYEGGLRDGELLSMNVGSLEFNEYGAKIHVNGKTGKRSIQLIESVPELREWLSVHPQRGNPDAPLWPSLSRPNKVLGEDGLELLYKKYAKRAGITKRVYPYLMRHSRATHLAAMGFNEAQMRKYFGWSDISKMPSIYIHLSGRDVNEGLLRAYGIKPEGDNDLSELTPKTCPRCSFQNPTTTDFCRRCQSPLDAITAFEAVKIKEQSDDVVTKLVEEVIKRAPDLVRQVLRDNGLEEKIEVMLKCEQVELNSA